ncbi:hypothetical protein V496_02473 [Pseudogymnoascus sp. VKM F-4515 (FW-2607)]|nr:hypothetical protein V496_02473 [Pseudogymnoascus sp. VKM F-4515 (FW-2607)]KFY98555.1 hypothetical protein V498_01393 [Pseudogymnoascus sp. VKM F-4517 (FW-2822)]
MMKKRWEGDGLRMVATFEVLGRDLFRVAGQALSSCQWGSSPEAVLMEVMIIVTTGATSASSTARPG